MKTKIKNIKHLLLLCLIICLSSILSSCVLEPDYIDETHDNRFSASEVFSEKYYITTQKQLCLNAINGAVEIIGVAEQDTLRIWGEKRVQSDSREDAEMHLKNLSVHSIVYDTKIVVETSQPSKSYGRNYQVFYHIRIPNTWEVFVNNINGAVMITSINNLVNLSSTNGENHIEDIYGNVTSILINGNMRLWNIEGNLHGQLTNGNINSQLFLPESGECKLHTVNGEINLSIPRSTSAYFSAGVQNGTISIKDITIHTSQSTKRSITGILGDGEGKINLQTVNGNISVNGF